jgi:hypothetical protein
MQDPDTMVYQPILSALSERIVLKALGRYSPTEVLSKEELTEYNNDRNIFFSTINRINGYFVKPDISDAMLRHMRLFFERECTLNEMIVNLQNEVDAGVVRPPGGSSIN